MQRSKIEQLPKNVRDWLDAALIDGNFSGYAALADELQARGYDISRSGTHRYGSKLQETVASVKEATLALQMLDNMGVDLRDARSGGLIALIQSDLFAAMQAMRKDSEMDPAKRAELLSRIGKNVAALARSSVDIKQHQMAVDEEDASGVDQVMPTLEVRFVNVPQKTASEAPEPDGGTNGA